jgi:cytoskeleton protein RodZ
VSDAATVGPGALLRVGRESRRLVPQDIADTLNLTLRVVEDVEAENWGRLPGPAFTRGYLRAYARLLEIDPDEVMQAFDAAVGRRSGDEVPVAGAMHQVRRRGVEDLLQKHPGAVLGGAVAAVICAVLVVLLAVWPEATDVATTARQPVAVTDPIVPRPLASESARESALGDVPGGAVANTDTIPVAPPVQVSAGTPAATLRSVTSVEEGTSAIAQRISAGGEDRLSFIFTEDCWVEIKDSQGATSYGDLGKSGSTLELVGQAPFRILLGNAPGVTLQFNGERVALSPHTRNKVGTLVLGQ